MSDMKKLLESLDTLAADPIKESDEDSVTIRFTRDEAKKLGLLTCKCGHPENNHFNEPHSSCARCSCQKYNEFPVAGTFVGSPSQDIGNP